MLFDGFIPIVNEFSDFGSHFEQSYFTILKRENQMRVDIGRFDIAANLSWEIKMKNDLSLWRLRQKIDRNNTICQ